MWLTQNLDVLISYPDHDGGFSFEFGTHCTASLLIEDDLVVRMLSEERRGRRLLPWPAIAITECGGDGYVKEPTR